MKNQYFGDVNDYRKYGLLRVITNHGLIKAAVCWMLTPDDCSSDGKFTTYLKEAEKWRQYDPDLFDDLKNITINKNVRGISEAKENQIISSAYFYPFLIPDDLQDRKKYFESFFKEAQGYDLIFFDPDNGIEVKSKPCGRKDSSKYLYWREIKDAFSAGHSLLIYQHFPRIKRDQFIQLISQNLANTIDVQQIYSFRTTNVLFLLACQPQHTALFQKTIQKIKIKWGTEFQITSHPFDIYI